MASITSSGVGSGLDIQGLVSQLVAAEGQPVSQRLDRKEAKLQAQLSALGSFKSALSSFKSSASNLASLSSLSRRTATSGNAELYTVTASMTAVAASYEVEVNKLAQAHKLASGAFSDPTTAVGTGTLTFQFGDPTKAAQTVTISDSNNSLNGIRDAVNAANIGVRASIVKGDNGYQLIFSSEQTGLDNSLKITVSENPLDGSNTDMNGLSQLAYDPAAAVGNGKNLTETAAAQDALVYIDGIPVSSATNTISDAINGITFTLKKADPGTKTTMTVAQDKAGASSVIQAFVKGFNDLVTAVNQLSGYNAETKQGGILIGDSSVRGVMSQLRGILGRTVAGLDGTYRALADLGIKTQVDGTLTVDTSKLDAALSNNFDEVGRLFAAVGTPSDTLVKYTSSTADTKVGNYALNISQIATQGVYYDTASAVSSLTVDSSNDTFAIKVDGVQSGTITLAAATYADGDALAAELQSKINGDSALQASGVTVSVAYDSGTNRFTFTSSRYGSASSVEITSVKDVTASGNIGLTVNVSAVADGVDAGGTIGGVAATGAGQFLTGAGNAAGLMLEITGGSTGSRGSVVFSRGVADQLNSLLANLLDADSFLSSRTDSLTEQIKGISSEREVLGRRLEALQARYLAQFTALDTLMAQMQQTSTFLTNQLASLPGAYSGSSS